MEAQGITERPTWKDLITGKWKPSNKQWLSHLMASDINEAARQWADTFTEDEAARVLSGDIDAALSEKLLTIPAELAPVLDELETIITAAMGERLEDLKQ